MTKRPKPAPRNRMFRRGLISICTALIACGLAAIPAAAAEQTCTLTVTTAAGNQTVFTLTLPANFPLSEVSLPIDTPVATIDESCAAGGSTSATGTGTSTTGASTTGTGTGTGTGQTSVTVATTTEPPTISLSRTQKSSTSKSHHVKRTATGASAVVVSASKSPGTNVPTLQGAGGAPSVDNPTFSFALPGAAPIGVPNFFIDSFEIPPFLLPIYQAAGIEYDVPWQVLAAINQIETDYGRNLSISSAGAVGWMQFLPSTFKQWGVAATGNGIADPYNPVDAIFTAARYLQAEGAARNLPKAIFGYNHASWYVQSVLLRAKLIGGMPSQLVGALTGLVQGHFPVAAAATYADDSVQKLATRRMTGSNAAEDIESDAATGTDIYAKQGAPVIAVNDGRIVKVGDSKRLGKFIELQDETGNVYTYSHLGSIPLSYPVPKAVKITAGQLAKELSVPTQTSVPSGEAASAGSQPASALPSAASATKTLSKAGPLTVHVAAAKASKPAVKSRASASSSSSTSGSGLVKERLFADPSRAGSYAAGGAEQVQSATAAVSSFQNYFSDILHLNRKDYTLAPLKTGAVVVAGTILGRIGANTQTQASHLYFQIQPAGKGAPQIDPKPILDGWKLLEATAIYRAAGQDPFFGPGAKNPTVGQVLLMSKAQLQERIVRDPHVTLDACTQRDIQAGNIDRRVLAVLEFLSASGLDPTATNPACETSAAGPDQAAETASGSTIDITRINNIPVLGHQGAGSITDITIRRLLTLQSSMAPSQIISLMSYKGQTNTLALPDHQNRIQIAYTPLYGQNNKLTGEVKSALKPKQWLQLINRISQIPEPTISTKTSQYAIKTNTQ
jgi:hypothetical protein